MKRISLRLAMVLAAVTAGNALAQEPGKLGLPPTAIDLEQNNPAKAAAQARAQAKADAAKSAADALEPPPVPATVIVGTVETAGTPPTEAESAALLRSVQDALQRDKRTAGLGLKLTLEGDRFIGLNGDVPSKRIRAAAESVAAKAAGPGRIQNHLGVVPR